MPTNKLKITQSLLSAWLYSFELDNGYEKFLNALNKIAEPTNEAMLNGIQFEGLVNTGIDGQPLDENHKWYQPVKECVELLNGSQKQVSIYKDVVVDGYLFELHGILDFLKEGIIYDTKFSKTYHLNKYLHSPQTPMYFCLVPEAYQFTYVICDGKYIYKESYTPDMVQPIEKTIHQFIEYLKQHNLLELYVEKWRI